MVLHNSKDIFLALDPWTAHTSPFAIGAHVEHPADGNGNVIIDFTHGVATNIEAESLVPSPFALRTRKPSYGATPVETVSQLETLLLENR
jgi:hypothetical protein